MDLNKEEENQDQTLLLKKKLASYLLCLQISVSGVSS